MIYTVRYCHLSQIYVDKGDTVKFGDKVGRMGNTGVGTGAHLHIDCVEDVRNKIFHLADMERGIVKPALRQLNYFIDDDLFGTPLLITTPIADADYMAKWKKLHLAYDVVPEDRKRTDKHWDIFWNRSMKGTVLATGNDSGYGNYVYIGFDA